MSDFQIVAGGDACLVIEFPPAIDEALTLRCASIARDIGARHESAIRDIVATFHTVAVYFDPRRMQAATLEIVLRQCASAPAANDVSEGRVIEVPVHYGGEFGPDLAAVASFGRCTEREVVQRHSARLYRVFMLGFLPGFAYMGHVDERIAAPRLDTPRARVAAGSVAIAGPMTAVYSLDSPGGWQIVGRTSLRMFDRDRPDPFLLRSADRVKFVPIDDAGSSGS